MSPFIQSIKNNRVVAVRSDKSHIIIKLVDGAGRMKTLVVDYDYLSEDRTGKMEEIK